MHLVPRETMICNLRRRLEGAGQCKDIAVVISQRLTAEITSKSEGQQRWHASVSYDYRNIGRRAYKLDINCGRYSCKPRSAFVRFLRMYYKSEYKKYQT